MKRLLFLLTFFLSPMLVTAQSPASVSIHVKEPAGIRRSAFPATARVSLDRGRMSDSTPARLLLNGTAVPAQVTPTAHWPDGSVQTLDVDFNASPGPNESLDFVFEYGSGVTPPAPGRGLTLAELGDAIQVGNVRFSRMGQPLMASVKYRDEAIGSGANGFQVTDSSGTVLNLADATDLALVVVKRGPLVATLKYTGTLLVGGTKTPFTMSAEMPSSKSWIKLSASVDDSARRVKSLALTTPLALGPLPWVWDFGTARWTYGQLRNATDTVTFTQTSRGGTAEWAVTTNAGGREQIAESNTLSRMPFGGWAHVQGGKEVVAVAVEEAAGFSGVVRMTQSGGGDARVELSPATPSTRHTLTVYEHFVSTPVQIGAATSPAAILAPLVVTVDPK